MGDDIFNNPFAARRKELLREVRKGGGQSQPGRGDGARSEVTRRDGGAGESTERAADKARSQAEEARLLREYYEGVRPIDRSNDLPPPRRRKGPSLPSRAEQAAAFYDFVHGRGEFDIEFLDEYVTGLAPGVDHSLLRRLKRGEFAIQAHIDLHGMYWDEARVALVAFFEKARRQGKRCVLVVHGRGLHSPEGAPTLKENLLEMLTRGPLSKHVLAFATARRVDGGPGAMYVLLRRTRTPFR